MNATKPNVLPSNPPTTTPYCFEDSNQLSTP